MNLPNQVQVQSIFLLFLIGCDLTTRSQSTREINPHPKFLYAPFTHPDIDAPYPTTLLHHDGDDVFSAIPLDTILIDYEIHLAPSGDFTGKTQEEHAKYAPGENDEERHVRPAFLHQGPAAVIHPHHRRYHPYWSSSSENDEVKEHDEEKETYNHNTNRVVQFYNPWSGSSQQYVKSYIQLALEINVPLVQHLDEDSTHLIKFYAISCSAHHWVCKDNDIQSYPTLFAFPKDSTESIVLDWKTLTVDELRDVFDLPTPALVQEENETKQGEQEENLNQDEVTNGPTLESEAFSTSSSPSPTMPPTTTTSTEKDASIYNIAEVNIDTFASVDILGASEFVYQRVKRETYSDAITSLTYALEYDIFPCTSQEPTSYRSLSSEQQEAFVEWIDLLYWALPSNWKLQTLIHDIRSNIDNIVESRDALIQLVYLHHDVVHEGHVVQHNTHAAEQKELKPKSGSIIKAHQYQWSPACTQSNKGRQIYSSSSTAPNGYTCGMWNLVHILSTGIAERHSAILGARDRATVVHSIHTIAQYLHHFTSTLGMQFSLEKGSKKDDSKSNITSSSILFLKEQLLKCAQQPYHYCPHLYKKTPSISSTRAKTSNEILKQKQIQEKWKYQQMVIYLWEVHNQYNVHVWKHLIQKQKGYIPHNPEEEREVMWPQKELCYECQMESRSWKQQYVGSNRGGWDVEQVFDFLKTEYWPNGVHNFRYVVLEKRNNVQTLPKPPLFHLFLWEWNTRSKLIRIMGVLMSAIFILSRWKQFQMRRTGRHKKFETESV